ncbi:cation:proton antiporter [Desulfotalea psychrophila]|uniref:Related to Na+/H+ antiporter protein n=1 Tax=Desulfotalea psychrophila (strain LSv54 / DSM 12343) TaxID=177439 RepID=Q6ARJ0_DESPS|nr:cation:proton antiporter [Desulfotalea psychrophila]CAG35035.1 related to Na+/H+ antiporter protein [Desulfotalea psychrophila LSv54]
MTPSTFEPLLILGLVLVTGYFAGRAANFFGLPRISGYIVSGLIFSPSVSGIISFQQIDHLFSFTSEIALAFIAYSIGGSLLMSRVRGLGKEILWITLTQGLGAFICTCLTVYAVRDFLPASIGESGNTFLSVILILGSISAATAPAATMAIIHELRAKGPLTTTLLGVVALDDALTIIIFSGAITIASQLLLGQTDNSLIMQGITTVAGAIAIGLIGGLIFKNFLDPAKHTESNLMLTLGAIFLISGSADRFGFSPLLANMVMGFVIINRVKHAEDLFHKVDTIKETIFCLFFTLAAAHFDPSVFASSAFLGIVLLIGRFSGKLIGTFLGGKISKASPQIYKNLGMALLPKAGLSLGLILLAKPILSAEIFDLLLNAMLVSITLNEIISPPLAKWAITRAGEANPDR